MTSSRPKSTFELSLAAPRTGRAFLAILKRNVPKAHAAVGRRSAALTEMSIALVGDATMAQLHQRHMNIPGTTDVLTFPIDHDHLGRVVAGEVVICVPEARRQAAANAVDPAHEVLLYAIHGMLHLCGYDDTTPKAYTEMHATEDRILMRLGVGRVFSATPGKDAATSTRRRAGSRRLSGRRGRG